MMIVIEMGFRPQTTGSFFCADKRTNQEKSPQVIVAKRDGEGLPAKLKKLASLKQFLIFNAVKPSPSLQQSKGGERIKDKSEAQT